MYNHQLDTFIQAADAGSFSRAAELLYISPTAVMKQINLLDPHRCGKVLLSGRQVHDTVRQGRPDQSAKRHAEQ